MTEEYPPIHSIDWRYHAATWITEDFVDPQTKVRYKKGTPVTRPTFVKHGERIIRIGDPSASALFLSQSHRAHEQALQIHPFSGEWPPADGQDPSIVAYDYLEWIIASIVFAYTAIEAFANEEIPEDFVYEYEERTDSGLCIARQRHKGWIERHLSLSEKLDKVLPEAVGKSSPKGSDVWEDYVHLRRLRDRIIHLKSKDRAHSKAGNLYPDSIWSELLNPSQRDYPLIAKSMIVHFKGEDSTHWLKYCPF